MQVTKLSPAGTGVVDLSAQELDQAVRSDVISRRLFDDGNGIRRGCFRELGRCDRESDARTSTWNRSILLVRQGELQPTGRNPPKLRRDGVEHVFCYLRPWHRFKNRAFHATREPLRCHEIEMWGEPPAGRT
jgi:hypothetical protein